MSESEVPTQMSQEETIEVIKGLCRNFANPSFSAEVEEALNELDEIAKDPTTDKESVVYTYYSTLGQIVTRSSILASMEAFHREVMAKVETGLSEEEAVSLVMKSAGLAADVEGLAAELKDQS